jgi:hypothetical protein
MRTCDRVSLLIFLLLDCITNSKALASFALVVYIIAKEESVDLRKGFRRTSRKSVGLFSILIQDEARDWHWDP